MLGCNNYEIIDLGVMVPCERILETAVKEQVDMIGLSGLITPSLDEMVHVASEMERQGFDIPLLIGGATTSAKHTAVKIAPAYRQATVHVLDASRSVGVVDRLNNPDTRPAFDADNRRQQSSLVESYNRRQQVNLVPYEEARARHFVTDWKRVEIDVPRFTGVRVLDDFPLAALAEYIDWSPFFLTWELKGKYPRIFERSGGGSRGDAAVRRCPAAAGRIIAGKLLTARGVYGFWPAASEGDDIVLFADESRHGELARSFTLRQQWRRKGQETFLALADFVAPIDSGRRDFIGAFAVTAGIGTDELVARYERDHDDYSAIMVKALADRLAEAFAECLHQHGAGRLGLWAAREAVERRADRRDLSRHPAGARLSGLPRPHGETDALRAAGCRSIPASA